MPGNGLYITIITQYAELKQPFLQLFSVVLFIHLFIVIHLFLFIYLLFLEGEQL